MNDYQPEQYYGYYPSQYQPMFWQAAFSALIGVAILVGDRHHVGQPVVTGMKRIEVERGMLLGYGVGHRARGAGRANAGVGRPSTSMGFEPVVVTGRPTTHPGGLGARRDSCCVRAHARPFPLRGGHGVPPHPGGNAP